MLQIHTVEALPFFWQHATDLISEASAFNRYILQGPGGAKLFTVVVLQMHFSFTEKKKPNVVATLIHNTHYHHDLFSVCILYPDVAITLKMLLGWDLSATQSILGLKKINEIWTQSFRAQM